MHGSARPRCCTIRRLAQQLATCPDARHATACGPQRKSARHSGCGCGSSAVTASVSYWPAESVLCMPGICAAPLHASQAPRATCGQRFSTVVLHAAGSGRDGALQRLADERPHGFLKRAMFEALAEHCVPEPRAAWLVKLIYFGRHRCAAGATFCTETAQSLRGRSAPFAVLRRK